MAITKVTSKGTTTIPRPIRAATGLLTGSRLAWTVRAGVIEARLQKQSSNALQQHIQARAGSWEGSLSGVALLRKTRP